MKEYVVGFLFDNEKENVVLIRKNRPEWQAGRLNGVGGKIEEYETPYMAMRREWREETGVEQLAWSLIAVLNVGPKNTLVHVFSATNSEAFNLARTNTDEEIEKIPVREVHEHKTIANVPFLIHLGRSGFKNINLPIIVNYAE